MSRDLSQMVPPTGYRADRIHIFRSKGSFDWFVRRHRVELVHNEALLLLAGRWMVDPLRFDAYLLQHGTTAAQAQIT